ncbi:MAG: phospholipase D-like domain-containing protein, partial [Bdellovibrionaceae bacterium]|nr:phospholipase D-like domain-containing protein [Pseudobdellovibrionaceae bacterium]
MRAPWVQEQLYFDGDRYFDALIAAIERAQKSIVLETYIFYSDEMGRWLESHLASAAKRGVRVRVVVDGIGANSWIHAWNPLLLKSGVEVRIWNPLYVGPFLMSVARGLLSRKGVSRLLSHTNRRTHRKYCVIDGETAFVGSLNISSAHLARFSGDKAWRDTGIQVHGPEVDQICNAFDHVWDRSYTPSGRHMWFGRRRHPELDVQSPVRLNLTRR